MTRTFVGLGFGPIQSGLFLLEAQASGNFERLVVSEISPDIVSAVRSSGGKVWINVAHHDRVQVRELTGLEIYSPLVPDEIPRLVEAIAEADEIATALPSVDFFDRGHPSPSTLLALGIQRKLADERRPRAIIYAAENDNRAAEKLRDAVVSQLSPRDAVRLDEHVVFLNTVIGKMSGLVRDPKQIERDQLATFIRRTPHAILVEQFNRILISRISLVDFQRGIDVFEEKTDLLPFEEAKLYGHNAAHALLGCLAQRAGITFVCDSDTSLLQFVQQAFIKESGGALCERHRGVDPLFTPVGWTNYALDLSTRMVNPYLRDRADRLVRDPRRKLAWNDRFIGTMRLALEHNIDPHRYALGAALAVDQLLRERPATPISFLLNDLWGDDPTAAVVRRRIIRYIEIATRHCHRLHRD